MSGGPIVDGDGRPIGLGDLLGRGGEGIVRSVPGRPLAVKLYFQPDDAREAKVRSMIDAGLSASCPGVAFPTGLAFDDGGRFVGFTMPAVVGHRPIHEMYSPSSRRRHHPGTTWHHLVRTAANTARLIARIHAAGAVVGDLNASGILASSRALVAMIDADSFQWKTHACRVGVQEYTPPELQGRSLDGVIRTTDHDAFGLAVIVFQLLFLGRHPHAGVPKGRDLDLGEAIAQSSFAYTRVRSVRASPPAGTLALDDLPLGAATLFERAFAPPGYGRPTPEEWVAELERLEAGLTTCSRNEAHDRPANRPCAWCRIERETRSAVFGKGTTRSPVVPPRPRAPATASLKEVLSRTRREAGEGVQPALSTLATAPSPKPADVTPDAVLRRHLRAQDEYQRALEAWRGRIGAWSAARRADALIDHVARTERYASGERARLGAAMRAVREETVLARLAERRIYEANIPGIGRRRVELLRSHGVGSAAEVSIASLAKIPGLGEQARSRLLIWRDALYAAADRTTPTDEMRMVPARDRFRTETAAETGRLKQRTEEMIRALAEALDKVTAAARLPDPQLASAAAALDAATEQLRARKLQAAGSPAAPPKTKSGKKMRKASNKGPACPKCGGPMVRRWPKPGSGSAARRYGCAAYPRCGGARP